MDSSIDLQGWTIQQSGPQYNWRVERECSSNAMHQHWWYFSSPWSSTEQQFELEEQLHIPFHFISYWIILFCFISFHFILYWVILFYFFYSVLMNKCDFVLLHSIVFYIYLFWFNLIWFDATSYVMIWSDMIWFDIIWYDMV